MPATAVDEDVRSRLARWLGSIDGTSVVPADLMVSVPTGGGWSNDTWILTAGSRRVVVRAEPQRIGMFPTYDLARQVEVLRGLEKVPSVPTPPVLADDPDGRWLGRPAFVMGFVDGRAPSDDKPSFAEAGWLHDAAPEEQRQFFVNVLRCIAAVHAVDPDVIPGWRGAAQGSDPTVGALEDLRATWEFDRGPVWADVVDDAFAEIAATVPEPTGTRLLWGDARPANVLCAPDGFDVVALLDWELAMVGTPEIDVSWLLEMNWMRMQGAGLDPLPGFPDDVGAVRCYEHASGRVLDDLAWYRRLAALRVAVLMHRFLRSLVHAGRLAPEHAVLVDNVSTRRLASVIGRAGDDHGHR